MMLLICMKTGLTAHGKVYTKGDFFPIPHNLTQDFRSDMSEEKWRKKQMGMFGEVLFRKPLPDDLKEAYHAKKIVLSDVLDEKQRVTLLRVISDKATRQAKLADEMIDEIEAPEKKAPTAGELKQKKERALKAEKKKRDWEKTLTAEELKQKKERALKVEGLKEEEKEAPKDKVEEPKEEEKASTSEDKLETKKKE